MNVFLNDSWNLNAQALKKCSKMQYIWRQLVDSSIPRYSYVYLNINDTPPKTKNIYILPESRRIYPNLAYPTLPGPEAPTLHE